MTIIKCNFPLNVEHCDCISVEQFSKSSASLSPSVHKNPPLPIPFVFKVKKMDKVDGTDADKTEWINLELLMDPENPASNILPTLFYLQQLIPSGVDQVGDGLL
jgi:hypothetical protein